ncbi:MAG: ABC transporter permease, partial [Myxococcota bacterium]
IEDATLEGAARLEERARTVLGDTHDIAPRDRTAIRVRNNVERFQRVQQIFGLLEAFVWLVGIGTVTAGIVGVSNIMLVSVRERTAEIGLRKALGARPGQILQSIVAEAVLLTATAGYVGIVAGVVVIELVRATLPPNDYLREPEVTLLPAAVAAVALVVFGVLAGLVPAWQAARVHPVEALRDGA